MSIGGRNVWELEALEVWNGALDIGSTFLDPAAMKSGERVCIDRNHNVLVSRSNVVCTAVLLYCDCRTASSPDFEVCFRKLKQNNHPRSTIIKP